MLTEHDPLEKLGYQNYRNKYHKQIETPEAFIIQKVSFGIPWVD